MSSCLPHHLHKAPRIWLLEKLVDIRNKHAVSHELLIESLYTVSSSKLLIPCFYCDNQMNNVWECKSTILLNYCFDSSVYIVQLVLRHRSSKHFNYMPRFFFSRTSLCGFRKIGFKFKTWTNRHTLFNGLAFVYHKLEELWCYIKNHVYVFQMKAQDRLLPDFCMP